MDEAIQGRRCKKRVAEEFRPLLYRAVGGENQGSMFIALANDLVEVVRSGMAERFESPVVENQQVGLEIVFKLGLP